MTISENSLIGNVKHNTDSILDKVKLWAAQKRESLVFRIDRLAKDKRPSAKRELEKMANEHAIPHTKHATKHELVDQVRRYFNEHELFLK